MTNGICVGRESQFRKSWLLRVVFVGGLLVQGCSPAPISLQTSSAAIGTQGGSVNIRAGSPGAGATVDVPMGALSSSVTISVGTTNDTGNLPQGVRSAGPIIAFGPDGQTFSMPVTITLPTTSAATGVLTRSLTSPTWTRLPAETVRYDSTRQVMIATVTHFSDYVPVTESSDAGTTVLDGAVPDSGTTVGCSSSRDCAVGQVCTNGVCVAPPPVDAGMGATPDVATNTGVDASADGSDGDAGMGATTVDTGTDGSDGGLCTTGTRTTECSASGRSYCADLLNDRTDCGACNNSCSAGQQCLQGRCVSGCSANSDCAVGQVCVSSTCRTPPADAGACTTGTRTTVCSASGGSYCADLTSDNNDCGACGNQCAAGLQCQQGRCLKLCSASADCGSLNICVSGVCSYDPAYAGGALCSTGPRPAVCLAGTGVLYCANLVTDVTDCGSCGHFCGSGSSCRMSHCDGELCGVGTNRWCNGVCVDRLFDPTNCGVCGNVCAAGQQCVRGFCQP